MDHIRIRSYSAMIIGDHIITTNPKSLTRLQIIKLVYISHGFTLAMLNRPLIRDRIEAWQYGPVIPALYYTLKGYHGEPISELRYCGTGIDDQSIKQRRDFFEMIIGKNERGIIDRVIEVYGNYTSSQLSGITHQKNTPWSKCYKKGELFTLIPNNIIKEHYKQLLV